MLFKKYPTPIGLYRRGPVVVAGKHNASDVYGP